MKNIPFEKRTFPLGSERSIWEANVPFEKGTFPLWSERSLWEVDVPFEKGTFALKRERSLWKRTFALKANLSGFLQTAEI